jgi:hypothetical protein
MGGRSLQRAAQIIGQRVEGIGTTEAGERKREQHGNRRNYSNDGYHRRTLSRL